ncbi:ABC transporter-associated protein EcsC [Salipaludibacillus keqinensis]|uniref:ABC transporter-associated protein EcsC n=1 Tax=Salipaludibacillus keqinensis TaxID=2045207 RepID=A0A323TH18_9BACI|nr:EcsC family protein [Salipaludibacillus keqinensis]PYZ94118.1 ABC transporter-associated protein EcsC [Salipaludibacillus keqinensis]
MSDFLSKVERELERWEYKTNRSPSMPAKVSRRWQKKVNDKIPEKVHRVITASVKQMVRGTLASSDYLSDQEIITDQTLEERETLFEKRVHLYKRTAAIEGAGTGFGGIFLGIADFPLLLNIKMKFLFETAKIYGFDSDDMEERLFLLHIFQLAFSKEERKKEVFHRVTDWENTKKEWEGKTVHLNQLDWKAFQLEYRDFIDLPKTMQLIPGFGAIVGATANYHYLDILAYHAKNSYRHRFVR